MHTTKILTIIKILILITLPITILYSYIPSRFPEEVQADEVEDLQNQLDNLQKRLAELQKQQQDLQSLIESEEAVQDDLTSQINAISNEIRSLELKIEEKEVDIEAKETEIKILEQRITENTQQTAKIEKEMGELEMAADNIITSIYIDSKTNSLLDDLLTSSESQSFFSRLQYHLALGENEKSSLEQLQANKTDLENLTEQLEEDKLEVEKIAESIKEEKRDLEMYNEQLSEQKNNKDYLLAQSQQSVDSYYQSIDSLSEEEKKALAEINYVRQQLFESIGYVEDGQYVMAGTVIGTEGSTGCSSGPHTHFEVYDNNVNQNPCSYLPSGVQGGCGIGIPKLSEWPYQGSYFITGWYFPPYHSAIDVAYSWSSPTKYVYATHDGWLFRPPPQECSSSWCPYTCNGPAKFAVICENKDCTQGIKTFYYHLQ